MIETHNPLKLETPISDDRVHSWIKRCAPKGTTIHHIQIILLDDEGLLDMNKSHLQHDYYTDILTFDYSEAPDEIDCELYISLDRVKDNAHQLGETFKREYLRVIAHGMLHLLGFNDKSDKEQALMRAEEDRWIDRYASSDVSRETP